MFSHVVDNKENVVCQAVHDQLERRRAFLDDDKVPITYLVNREQFLNLELWIIACPVGCGRTLGCQREMDLGEAAYIGNHIQFRCNLFKQLKHDFFHGKLTSNGYALYKF